MTFKYIVVLFLLVNVCTAQIRIEESSQQNSNSFMNTISTDAIYSIDNTIEGITSPLNFDGNDLIFAGFILGITGASFNIDNDIRHNILKTRSKNLDEIMYYGEKFGRPIYATYLSAFLYTTGLISSNDYLKETGQILAEAMICTGLFTELLKETIGRARPFTGESYKDISPFEFEFAEFENSLPSGHTSIAFTVATVLSERFDNIYASMALYGMASLTAYQRIYSDVHWFSDVLLGAALGTFIGLKIVNLHEEEDSSKRNMHMNFFPLLKSNTYGVGFSLDF